MKCATQGTVKLLLQLIDKIFSLLSNMLEPQTLKFLSALKKNNTKPWFDAHRANYEAAKINFGNFIQGVIDDLQRTDTTVAGIGSKDCLFRINRDVRFSNDKTPYKSNMGASIKRGGRKSCFAGYYFHLEPGASFAGGGLWMPDAPALKALRQEVDYNWQEFESILSVPLFKKTFGDLYMGANQSLATAPKGYAKDNPAMRYLKLKSFIAETGVADEELTQPTLHKKTVAACKVLQPLLNFINRTITTA